MEYRTSIDPTFFCPTIAKAMSEMHQAQYWASMPRRASRFTSQLEEGQEHHWDVCGRRIRGAVGHETEFEGAAGWLYGPSLVVRQ